MQPLRRESYAPMEDPHLSVVVNDQPTRLSQRRPVAKLPDFEGKEVSLSSGKVFSVRPLDLDGAVYAMDEIVKVVVEARVAGVHHDVDETTGKLVRVHKLKALEGAVVEWDFDLESLRGEA